LKARNPPNGEVGGVAELTDSSATVTGTVPCDAPRNERRTTMSGNSAPTVSAEQVEALVKQKLHSTSPCNTRRNGGVPCLNQTQ
jgi:hypothetical protein